MSHPKILATHCPWDAVLHAVAPLGLATSLGSRSPQPSVLVIDLDPASPPLPGKTTLAELIADSPRSCDLKPLRSGVAILPNGGASTEVAVEMVNRLATGWDRIVVRTPSLEGESGWPTVPVYPLIPEFPHPGGPAVFQTFIRGSQPNGVGITLPPLSRSAIRALLRGKVEPRRRWVRAWHQVWEAPWV